MKASYKYALLLFVLVETVTSIELQPRKSPDCAYLVDRIYCYGGYVDGSSADDTLTALDINSNNGQSYQNLVNQWTPVTPQPTSIYLGFRGYPQAIPLPDGKRFMFQGGYNYANSSIVDQTIVYNAQTNSWSTFPNYFDTNNGGNRQIYYGTGVSLPDINAVGFYGGYQQHVVLGSDFITPNGTSISGLTFNNSEGYTNSFAGFYYFTLLDLNTNTWSIPQQYSTPLDYHILQSVTYHPGTKKIFYLGGNFYNTTSQSLYDSYLTYATTFDTTNAIWKYEDVTGPDIPKERSMHTATLLPDGQNILMYGGTYDTKTPLMDYCYTLNVPKMQWTYHNLATPVGVSGPRSHHAAVLVNNTSLFILFGVTKLSTTTNDLLILDVRDVNNLTFASNYPFNQVVPSPPTNNSTNSTSSDNKVSVASNSLSTGTIAGIAVGCGVAGILSIVAIILLVRRNKKDQNHQSSNGAKKYDSNNNSNNPMVDTDWDRIDNQYYKEIDATQFIQQKQRTSMTENNRQFLPNEHASEVEHPRQFIQQQQRASTIEGYVSETPSVTVVSPDAGFFLPESPHKKVVLQAVKPDGGF